MVLGNRGRGFSSALFGPLARLLVRLGVSPDAVTIAGTVAVVVAALSLFPTGQLLAGSLVVGFFVVTDSIDGMMARQLYGEAPRPYGEFLDSTLDRFSDAAIFIGLALHFALMADGAMRLWSISSAVACLALGGLVSYARAKAQALGVAATVGIAERADRLIVALVAALAVGVGLPAVILPLALTALAAASAVTVCQRIAVVRAALTTTESSGQAL